MNFKFGLFVLWEYSDGYEKNLIYKHLDTLIFGYESKSFFKII